MNLDAKDIAILRTVAEARTGSPDEIHERTGIPASTVHYRLKRLREDGIVKNDLFDVDRDALGFSLTVISEVDAEYQEGYHESVGEKLGAIDGVNEIHFVMGDSDFVVISHLPNRNKVEDLIASFEAIDEVTRSSSKFVISTVEEGSSVLTDYGEETILDALDIPPEGSVASSNVVAEDEPETEA